MADPPDGPVDPSADPFAAPSPSPSAEPQQPPPPEPSQSPAADARRRRRVWRRRRRIMGSLIFVAIVIALGVVVASAVGGDDDEAKKAAGTGSTASTTTTLPPAGPYRVTDGVNVRAGPGAAFPVLGQIEVGNTVLVVCAIDGESVSGPGGATTKWLKIVVLGPDSYVTAAYVAVGADILNPAVIGPCPAI